MSSHAKGILDILTNVSGLLTNWTAIANSGFTPTPDQQIAIRHSGGSAGELAVAIDYPRIQILGRGKPDATGYDDAWGKLDSVRRALIGIPQGPTAFPNLTCCSAVSDILDLGRDDQNRPQFSLNLQLIVSYASSGYREAL